MVEHSLLQQPPTLAASKQIYSWNPQDSFDNQQFRAIFKRYGPGISHLVTAHATALQDPAILSTDAEIDGMSTQQLLALGEKALSLLRRVSPQAHVDGMNNAWIVKPAGKSRGRGIQIFNKMQELLDYFGEPPVLSRVTTRLLPAASVFKAPVSSKRAECQCCE